MVTVGKSMAKILIIEDEVLVRESICELLALQGFEISSAGDGSSGLQSARQLHPDLIICDITMPGLNGHEVLVTLQADPETSSIPFIFLTAKSDMEDLRKGMKLGADDYLSKPVIIDELIAAVKARITRYHKITRHYEEEITRTRSDLEKTKNYDQITGLPKIDLLEQQVTELKKSTGQDALLALMIVKIDRFRNVIDLIGQSEYASLISLLLERIREICKNRFRLYWSDRDEFAILVNGLTKRALITALAGKILNNIRRPLLYHKQEMHFTASIGITLEQLHSCEVTRMITETELALHYAIEKGHNNFQYFESKIKKHIFDRIHLENALHRALDNQEFVIYYQPKINLADKKIVGVEALLRWQHENFGIVSPAQFIPLAEQNGLIVPIGDWLTSSICRQIREWKERGITVPPVAINVSGGQLREQDFIGKVSTLMQQTAIRGTELEFELTESILISSSPETLNKLGQIRKMGIGISIDDFGTGYSSLQYLKNFPHDHIKIDQSFIRDIITNENTASIVSSIISLAHKMGVKVIAEGVENSDQVKYLTEHHCDEIQGFYFSKPLSADSLAKIIAE
jgi:EAL domain-containing protein (putative c-di-GMP-specific phosphodiesterase class I)/PleD family two-component response regulator